MQSEYSRDLADPDKPVKDAAAERPGQPIKLRIQPMLLKKNGQYRGWTSVAWSLECDNVAETLSVRDTMTLFFRALARVGPAALNKVLKETMQTAA